MAIPRNLNTTARYTFSNGSQTTIQSQSYYRLSNAVRELEDRNRSGPLSGRSRVKQTGAGLEVSAGSIPARRPDPRER
jgi:hypothetical protein